MAVSGLAEIVKYDFVVRALIVGIIVSVCAAMLGVILVLKKYSLIGHGLADVGFGSLSLALAFGLNPLAVSVPIVIIASVCIMSVNQRKGMGGDAVIGMVATGSLAFGVIVTAMSKGFNTDVYNYMFGSILAMSRDDVILSLILSIIVIGTYIALYNRLFMVTYDETYAEASGINVKLYQFLISLMTAFTVVIGMKMMGTMLISSLIIFPAMSAGKIVDSFKLLVVWASIIAVVCFIIGVIISFMYNLPTGASIVLANIAVIIILSIVKRGK